MTYANAKDLVEQLNQETLNLYNELSQAASNETLNPEAALEDLKNFSQEIGKVTGDFLFNLCSTNPTKEDNSFEKLQDIQTWVKETIIVLVKLTLSGSPVQEQAIIPPYPRK